MPPAAPATTSGQALSNLQTAQAQQQTPDQIQQGADQSLGVPQAQQGVSALRQAIASTTNLLNNVAPTVYGNTQNSLVTSAQAGQQIQNASAPIQQTLSGQNTSLSNDQSNLSNLLSEAGSEASLKEQGQTDQLTNLENIYNDLYTQEQNQAASQASAAQQAEAVRQFNATLASNNANAAASTAAKTPTTAETLSTAVQSMYNQLNSQTGSNGGLHQGNNYISPANYAKGMSAWTAEGLNPADYDKYFAQFRDPSNGHYVLSNGKYG